MTRLHWLRSRLRDRADSEHAQVFVRIAITALFAGQVRTKALPVVAPCGVMSRTSPCHTPALSTRTQRGAMARR